MPSDKAVHKYGYVPDVKDHRDHIWAAPRKIVADLPPMSDLRPKMPPIWDQGDLGSCTANATAGQCWFLDKTAPYEPSRLFIYYTTRMMEGTVNYDAGASIRDSVKSVVRYGYPPESMWPYDISKFKKKPGSKVFKAALKERALKYARVDQT